MISLTNSPEIAYVLPVPALASIRFVPVRGVFIMSNFA